jgi:hypothetical protein
MSSTETSIFSTGLEASSTALSLEDASVSLVPDDAFLSSNSLLTILAAFDPSFADLVAALADDLATATGQIAVTGGNFVADVLLEDGSTLVGSFDAPATLRDYADLAAAAEGTVTLSGGILDGAIAVDGQSASLSGLDLAALAGSLAGDLITAIDATVPFTNGAFALDLATALGPVSGLVHVAGGDLNLDLDTPFGQLTADIDFGDDAIFPFVAPVPMVGDVNGVVDFNSGNLVVSTGVFGDIAVPLSSLSGSLTLADGLATVDTAIPLGAGLNVPVSTSLELGPIASEEIAEFVQDLNGTGTLSGGILTAALDSPAGLFDLAFDVVGFTNQGADFFAGVDGLITLGEGVAAADLTTPLGPIDGSFDLATLRPTLETPLAELV